MIHSHTSIYIYHIILYYYIVYINCPPTLTISDFLTNISNIFESISKSTFIYIGDMHIQVVNTISFQAASFNKLIFTKYMHQHIHFPTRIIGNTIDIITIILLSYYFI